VQDEQLAHRKVLSREAPSAKDAEPRQASNLIRELPPDFIGQNPTRLYMVHLEHTCLKYYSH
jgi:hypothetical protein